MRQTLVTPPPIHPQVRRLSESEVKEVTLLGQNVNSYADFSESAPESGARR